MKILGFDVIALSERYSPSVNIHLTERLAHNPGCRVFPPPWQQASFHVTQQQIQKFSLGIFFIFKHMNLQPFNLNLVFKKKDSNKRLIVTVGIFRKIA